MPATGPRAAAPSRTSSPGPSVAASTRSRRRSCGSPSAPSAKRALRSRLIRRAGRNLSTLGPLMSGAVAGSIVNHRETRRLGEQVRDDLRRR